MWYVVQTISGREQTAIDKCRNALDRDLASDIFSPTCQLEKKVQGQWLTEEKTAFPGYVFIESEDSAKLEERLKLIGNVVTPVRIGGGFYPVSSEEEAVLRRLMDERYCIRYSVGYLVDEQLVIKEGPLQGFTEAITWMDRHKRVADLEVLLFEEKRRMRVGLEVIDRMTAQAYREMLGA